MTFEDISKVLDFDNIEELKQLLNLPESHIKCQMIRNFIYDPIIFNHLISHYSREEIEHYLNEI